VSNELYLDWLKSLKVGDKVVYTFRGIITIDKVKKITPKGLIRLESGESADIFGKRILPGRYDYSFQIEPLTPEIAEMYLKWQWQKVRKIPVLSSQQRAIREDNGDNWGGGGMREILFRGLTFSGDMVYGYYVATKDSHFICYNNQHDDDLFLSPKNIMVEVRPETVGQFTGFRDNKRTDKFPEGQRIFEGDVCSGIKGQTYQVVYSCNYAKWGLRIMGSDSVIARGMTFPLQQYINDDMTINIEVIGNIHQNPELLGGRG